MNPGRGRKFALKSHPPVGILSELMHQVEGDQPKSSADSEQEGILTPADVDDVDKADGSCSSKANITINSGSGNNCDNFATNATITSLARDERFQMQPSVRNVSEIGNLRQEQKENKKEKKEEEEEDEDFCFRVAQLVTEVVLMLFAASLLIVAAIVILSKKVPQIMESYEIVPKFLFILCVIVAVCSLARWIIVKVQSIFHPSSAIADRVALYGEQGLPFAPGTIKLGQKKRLSTIKRSVSGNRPALGSIINLDGHQSIHNNPETKPPKATTIRAPKSMNHLTAQTNIIYEETGPLGKFT